MGWSSGTQLFIDTWTAVRGSIPAKKRVATCMKVIEAFEAEDWDCQGEAIDPTQPEIQKALMLLHPEWDRTDEDVEAPRG